MPANVGLVGIAQYGSCGHAAEVCIETLIDTLTVRHREARRVGVYKADQFVVDLDVIKNRASMSRCHEGRHGEQKSRSQNMFHCGSFRFSQWGSNYNANMYTGVHV